MNPLLSRLVALRRRLRMVTMFRGGCWAVAVLLGSLAVACLLDQSVYLRSNRDLPSLIRALFLVGIIGGTGYVAYRFLLRPLRARTDDLSLALRVEEQYPVLNDSLASTVEFLQQTGGTPGVSSVLKREAVQRAMRLAQGCDFNKAVDTRGAGQASLALLGALALGLLFLLWNPSLAMTSLARLADPFGGHRWPGHMPQTRLEIRYPKRIGIGQKFTIQGQVHGVIPKEATIEFLGLSPSPQRFKIDPATGKLNAPIDITKQYVSFRFRVRAGDAVSPPEEGTWHSVEMRQPPRLASLKGEASPQLVLTFPRYTDLESPQKRAPGSGTVEGVAGTRVKLRGAADRALARVWVEYRPTAQLVTEGSYLAALGPRHPIDTLALLAGGNAVWGRTYGKLDEGDKVFTINFQPWTRGTYLLVLEDPQGLTLVKEYDANIFADPPPRVTFERPAGSMDVLPSAEIGIRVLAEDEVYAVRSVYLEYRRKGKDGRFLDNGPTRIPLYDHRAAEAIYPQVLSALAGMPVPAVGPRPRLRPKKVQAGLRWSLEGLGEEGDTLLVQACAHDFNDVVAFNVPGRSPVIELRIVSKQQFQAGVDDVQAKLKDELIRLREMQAKAQEKVVAAEQQWRATGKLRPEDAVEVAEAEQLQKEIQARIGQDPDKGLRGEIAKLRQDLRDNKMQRTGAEERLKAVQDELSRLARDHLGEIEPLLTNARKELENKPGATPPPPRKKGDLDTARAHQEEVRQSLNDLLKYLDTWGDLQQVRAELRKILDQQRELQKETEELELDTRKNPAPKDKAGKPEKGDKQRLTDEQEARRRTLAAKQNLLAQQAQELIDRMKDMAEKRALKDPQNAEKLQKAAELGDEQKGDMIASHMRDTARKIFDPMGEVKQPELNRAIGQQDVAVKILEKMQAELQESRDAEIERLIKKQKAEAKNLQELKDKLERLRKKARDIKKIADPKEKKAAQEKLAEEQRQLQEELEKKARELKRLQAPQAGKALNQAAEKLERGARKLDAGDDPDMDQQEALQQLQEAEKQLQQAQDQAEEELAREQLARIADQIKGLKDRQDAALAELTRVHKTMLRQGRWTEGLLRSLDQHGTAEEGLAKETASLKEKIKGALVFELIMDKTVQAMTAAAKRVKDRHLRILRRQPDWKEPLEKEEVAAEGKSQDQAIKLEQEASRRLQRLIDAVKPEPNVAQRPKKQEDKKGEPKKGDNEKKGKGMPGDGIPALAQLKALRAEQQEVNDRTREFAREHPNEAKLNPEGQAELESIRQDQERLFELFRKMTAAANNAPAGGANP
jgi:hypothetical protein